MYLTIMKPEVLQDVASLGRGLWIVEGPDGPALVVKAGKEFILAAREKRELKFYLAPYESDCSGLMKPDTHLGENARHIEVSDDQATSCLFR